MKEVTRVLGEEVHEAIARGGRANGMGQGQRATVAEIEREPSRAA